MSDKDEILTVSYYVNVKNMTEDKIKKLQQELYKLLKTYQENGHDVTVTLVYY